MAQDTSGVVQGLSAVAVVLSLIFVGIEIGQNTAAQRAQTRQGLAEGSREIILTLATDQRLAESFFEVFPRPGSEMSFRPLTPSDSVQARVLMFGLLRNAENVYLQFQEGVVDENVLTTYAFRDARFETETFKTFWQQESQWFDTSFVREFESANGISNPRPSN